MTLKTPFVLRLARAIRARRPEVLPLGRDGYGSWGGALGVYMLIHVVAEHTGERTAEAMLALFAAAAWFFLAESLAHLLYESDWRRWLWSLPVSEARTLAYLYAEFFRLCGFWLAVVLFANLFLPAQPRWSDLLLATACQASMLVGLASSLVLLAPRFPSWLAGLVLVCAGVGLGPLQLLWPRLAESAVKAILSYLPSGWCQARLVTPPEADSWTLPGLVAGASLALGLIALRRLRLQPVELQRATVPGRRFEETVDDVTARVQEHVLGEDVREQVRGQLLQGWRVAVVEAGWLRWKWPNLGPLEGWIGRGLQGRQAALAELLLGGNPGWTRRWKQAAGLAVLTVAMIWGLPDYLRILALLPALLSMLLGLSPAAWYGCHRMVRSGGNQPSHPYYSTYPVGRAEVLAVIVKVEARRWLAYLPLAWLMGLGWLGPLYMVGGAVLLGCLQAVLLLARLDDAGWFARLLLLAACLAQIVAWLMPMFSEVWYAPAVAVSALLTATCLKRS